MSRKKFDIAGIKFNVDKPTALQLEDLHTWVIWQYPKPYLGGFLGAVCPPDSEPYWIPSVVNPEKNMVRIFAQDQKNYNSPEEAAEYFADN